MAAKRSRKRKSQLWTGSRSDYVYAKMSIGLQLADVAAGLGMTADELKGFFEAGCVTGADEDLRELAKAVIDGELVCKENCLEQIRAGKNWMGAAWLLEHRFKGTWGKDAKPAGEGIPSTAIDWDRELGKLLKDEHGPLVQFLYSQGFGRLPSGSSPGNSEGPAGDGGTGSE